MIINGAEVPGFPGGHEYQISRLGARQQFHLLCRLAPIFAKVGSAVLEVGPGDPEEQKARRAAMLLPAVASELSNVESKNIDFILTTCLSVVKRKDGNGWADVQAAGTDKLMYPDMDIATILPLIIAAIEENLGSFFASAQPLSQLKVP